MVITFWLTLKHLPVSSRLHFNLPYLANTDQMQLILFNVIDGSIMNSKQYAEPGQSISCAYRMMVVDDSANAYVLN